MPFLSEMLETKRLLDSAAVFSRLLQESGIRHAFYGSVFSAILSSTTHSDVRSSCEHIRSSYQERSWPVGDTLCCWGWANPPPSFQTHQGRHRRERRLVEYSLTLVKSVCVPLSCGVWHAHFVSKPSCHVSSLHPTNRGEHLKCFWKCVIKCVYCSTSDWNTTSWRNWSTPPWWHEYHEITKCPFPQCLGIPSGKTELMDDVGVKNSGPMQISRRWFFHQPRRRAGCSRYHLYSFSLLESCRHQSNTWAGHESFRLPKPPCRPCVERR